MDSKEQTDHLQRDLELLIDRYRAEYDLTYAQVVGVLQIQIHDLCTEQSEEP